MAILKVCFCFSSEIDFFITKHGNGRNAGESHFVVGTTNSKISNCYLKVNLRSNLFGIFGIKINPLHYTVS